MAKKSAASKGYRKTTKKQPFLTKKEIYWLIGIVVAVVLAIVLFNLLYDDGFIGADEVQANDIVYYAHQDTRDRYLKVGTINELDGFTRTDSAAEDSPVRTYIFTPEDESSPIDNISVGGSYLNYQDLAASFMNYASALSAIPTETIETEVQGQPACVYSYTYDYYDPALDPEAVETEAGAASTEEKPSNLYGQSVSCYVKADENLTMCLHIVLTGDDNSFYMPEDQILDFAMQYTDAFTMVEKA